MPADDRDITIALQRAVVGVLLVVLAFVLGIQVVFDADIDLDAWWNSYVEVFARIRALAFALNFLGGGWFAGILVPLAGLMALLAVRRTAAALLFVTASAASAIGVQVMKAIFGRARPEEMLVVSDHGSFPSGHTANAATLAVIAFVLLPRVWVGVTGVAWVFVMAFSRTQVHAHWVSDTVGGALAGAGFALIVAAVFTLPLARERARIAGSLPAADGARNPQTEAAPRV